MTDRTPRPIGEIRREALELLVDIARDERRTVETRIKALNIVIGD